jgi:hypothetical protein
MRIGRHGRDDRFMTKSIMRVSFSDRSRRIDFSIRLSRDAIIDQLGFIYLVSAKFDGTIETDGTTFVSGDRKKFGSARVLFDKYEDWDAAKSHCSGHLDADGCVHSSYLGALSKADPGQRQAKSLHQAILGYSS